MLKSDRFLWYTALCANTYLGARVERGVLCPKRKSIRPHTEAQAQFKAFLLALLESEDTVLPLASDQQESV